MIDWYDFMDTLNRRTGTMYETVKVMLEEEYKECGTVKALAAYFGVTHPTMTTTLREHGIAIKKQCNLPNTFLTKEQKSKVKSMLKDRYPVKEIVKQTGVSRNSIWRIKNGR